MLPIDIFAGRRVPWREPSDRPFSQTIVLFIVLTLHGGTEATLHDGAALVGELLCRATSPDGRRTAQAEQVFGEAGRGDITPLSDN